MLLHDVALMPHDVAAGVDETWLVRLYVEGTDYGGKHDLSVRLTAEAARFLGQQLLMAADQSDAATGHHPAPPDNLPLACSAAP
jgi:hypothetical protein